MASKLTPTFALAAALVAVLSVFPCSPARASWAAQRLNAEMYDSCSSYTASHWNTVYANSPSNVRGLGVYVGGKTADLRCFEPDATWIANLNHSWYLVPIWDGLQAPCKSGATYPMSDTPSTAWNKG